MTQTIFHLNAHEIRIDAKDSLITEIFIDGVPLAMADDERVSLSVLLAVRRRAEVERENVTSLLARTVLRLGGVR